MKKKILLIDVDEVICFSGFLPVINEFLHTNYYLDHELISKERKQEFLQFLRTKNVYENPNFLPQAREVVQKLYQKYDVYLLSSCVNPDDYDGCGRMFQDKYEFLRRYFLKSSL